MPNKYFPQSLIFLLPFLPPHLSSKWRNHKCNPKFSTHKNIMKSSFSVWLVSLSRPLSAWTYRDWNLRVYEIHEFADAGAHCIYISIDWLQKFANTYAQVDKVDCLCIYKYSSSTQVEYAYIAQAIVWKLKGLNRKRVPDRHDLLRSSHAGWFVEV